jgi:glycosyltransferase involved in cell wall biosynthesis
MPDRVLRETTLMPQAPDDTLLCVANFAPDEGYAWWLMENFWVKLAESGRDRGLKPLLLYPAGGVIPAHILGAGIETGVQPFPGRGWRALRDAVKLVRERNIRVIYFTDRNYSSIAYLLLRLAGVRHIINHDHTPGDRPPVGGLKGLLKAAWRRIRPIGCDIQLCVSPLVRQRAIENARIPAGRVAVVQNGIVPLQCSGDGDYAHRVLDIPDGRLVCITVGRANPYKRLDFIIEVAKQAVFNHKQEGLVFVHCGDGPDMARLKSLVAAAGLQEHFIFAGRRSDVHALLCSADIAIHAAKGEAFSLAVVEYMSAGLPLLVPDVPSVCQAVRDGQTGVIYPDRDASTAARLLVGLARDPALRQRLGCAAADEVRASYTLEQMNRQFLDAIESVLGPVPGRRAIHTSPP